MQYTVKELIDCDGLHIVMVQGVPSPWAMAATAMMEHKGMKAHFKIPMEF